MERQCNDRTAPGEEQDKEAIGSGSRSIGLRLLAKYCSTPARLFANHPEWVHIAIQAFLDWHENMEPVQNDDAIVWFIADSSANWIKTDRTASGTEDKQSWEATAFQAARLLLDSGLPYLHSNLGSHHIDVVQINDSSGVPALVLGVSAPCGSPSPGEIILELGAGFPAFLYLQIERDARSRMLEEQVLQERESRKKELFFEMAHELHSKIDTDEILAEIIRRIQEFYPDASIDLLMTQDHPRSKLPVKPLRFAGMEEDTCTRAFMEGQILLNNKDGAGREYEMAVPISGKQGIYGVMHLHSCKTPFGQSDVQIMKILSEAAGSAFENAKLYEQSNILVNELRLINELTKQLNQSLKINEIFNFACTELLQIFLADFCCILQIDPSSRTFVVQATNVPAMLHETFDDYSGFAGMVCESKEPVIIPDYWANPSVTSKLMQITGARSLIAAPIMAGDEAKGVVLVAQRIPGFFTYDNYKLLQVLAGHVGLAVANASLHAEVRRMVITDNLTGLFARHYLDEQVGYHQKKDFCGSLIVVDIDHFKSVNDTYGHQVGDKILIQVSRIIRASIRETDIAARWGGEELAIYLPQVMTEQAVRIAERIRTKVEAETEPSVTVSCGVSEWNWQDEKISVETLFYRSDMALYKAKHDGRNSVKVG